MNACQGIDNFEYNEYDCLIDEKKAIDGWYTWTDSRHNARHILYHRNWKKVSRDPVVSKILSQL